MYFEIAVTWRASSRVWLAAYSCAPGSRRMWHSDAERDSAPCSPCKIEENDHHTSMLTSLIFCASSSLSPIAVLRSALADGLIMYSLSMSNGAEKSMYFRSSGSQKWSCVAEMILWNADDRWP